jgi:hypothetical protein
MEGSSEHRGQPTRGVPPAWGLVVGRYTEPWLSTGTGGGDLKVLQKAGNFLTSGATIIFCRNTLLHGVRKKFMCIKLTLEMHFEISPNMTLSLSPRELTAHSLYSPQLILLIATYRWNRLLSVHIIFFYLMTFA